MREDLQCRKLIWAHHAGAQPTTLDELEELVGKLWGDSEDDLALCRSAGLGAVAPARECSEKCLSLQWQSYYNEVMASETAVARSGAITVAYGIYMDTEAPANVQERLRELSNRLLLEAHDTTVLGTLLKMMKFYDFGSTDIVAKLMQQLESESPAVRGFAFQRIKQYTGCKEKYDPMQSSDRRRRQAEDVRTNCHAKSETAKPNQ